MISGQQIKNKVNRKISVEVYDTVTSTNLLAKTHLGENPLLLVAEKQTEGKGRGDKSFYSPKGGIYFSLRLSSDVANTNLITISVAVAVCNSVKKFSSANPFVKWVNDIIVDNKKICGILCEKTSTDLIIGIGINVDKNKYPENLSAIAGSISLNCPKETFIADVINNIFDTLNKSQEEIIAEYKLWSLMSGKKVEIYQNGQTILANAVDISDIGGLILQNENGIFEITSGDIRVLGLYENNGE